MLHMGSLLAAIFPAGFVTSGVPEQSSTVTHGYLDTYPGWTFTVGLLSMIMGSYFAGTYF